MSDNKSKNQEPLSKEDLFEYINFIITKQVKDSKHAKKLRRLSRRVTTLSDVTVLYDALSSQQDKMIVQLMEAVQVQQGVLERLGATEEMFKDAQKEYDDALERVQKELKEEEEKSTTIKVGEETIAKVDPIPARQESTSGEVQEELKEEEPNPPNEKQKG